MSVMSFGDGSTGGSGGTKPLWIVLASRSPRRRELLQAANMPHILRVANVDETAHPGEQPVEYVRRVAREKALAVEQAPDEAVIAADTTVVAQGEMLGKPLSHADCLRMLRLLQGRDHEVITGVCIRHGDWITVEHEATRVWFAPMTESEIEAYAETEEPADKAGGYAIQGIASRYIVRIEGSYSNVVGLPVALVWRELERLRNFLSSRSSSRSEE